MKIGEMENPSQAARNYATLTESRAGDRATRRDTCLAAAAALLPISALSGLGAWLSGSYRRVPNFVP
jgi:hypothetical protein